MRIYETPKFQRLRKKIRREEEKQALKRAIAVIAATPLAGKKLKGELQDYRSFPYTAAGQERRLIYQVQEAALYLLSFGPREGIYAK